MQPITLTLPYPISANRYWRPVPIGKHVTMVPTKEAKQYIADVSRLARAAGIASPYDSRVKMAIKLYPHRPLDWQKRMRLHGAEWDNTVQCMDLGNCEKVLSDALQGVIYTDDKWIWSETKDRMEPDEYGARVVVTITPIATAQPQLGLDISMVGCMADE